MRALFAADNRFNVNWGRGASIALRELLSEEFEISGTVSGELFDLSIAEAGFVGTLMPSRHYGLFRQSWTRQSRWPFSWYMRVERLYGAKDFISEDPVKSVDHLLAYKHRYWPLEKIYEETKESEVVIIDGDGDIIFSNPPRRQTLFILAIIELGLRLKKPVFVVNSMISDCPATGRNTTTLRAARGLFSKCPAVFLRDPESFNYVRSEMPEANARMVPDSLFAWYPRYASSNSHPPLDGDFLLPHPERVEYWGKLDFSEPYICIGGGALACSDPERAVQCYRRLVDKIAELGFRVYLTENDSPDSFLRRVAQEKGIGLIPVGAPILACGSVLANARLFVSGRYHPSIFASLGGTPCIFLGAQGHKMRSIAQVLGYKESAEFSAFPSDSEIDDIVSMGRDYLSEGESLRTCIRRVSKDRCDQVMRLPGYLTEELLRSKKPAETALRT